MSKNQWASYEANDVTNISKKRPKKRKRKIIFIILTVLLLILILGGIIGFMYINSALEPLDSSSTEEVTLNIPNGTSTQAIGSMLEENGVIESSIVFSLYAQLQGGGLQAGQYTFSPAMSTNEIVQMMIDGQVSPDFRITVPEGLNLDQIAEVFAAELPFTKEEFLNTVNDTQYIQELIADYPTILSEDILHPLIRTPLEGYLFASTYDFYGEPSVDDVVRTMLDQTEAVVTPYLDDIEAADLTVHEAFTFASIVEGEAQTHQQRRNIASVFYNRLDEGIPLQTDPTVLYALGSHQERVLFEDLEVESPYNTYMVDGLPIGPIGNFSVSSLESTVNPEDTNYIYFLHDAGGNIHFANTYDEHLQHKNQYID